MRMNDVFSCLSEASFHRVSGKDKSPPFSPSLTSQISSGGKYSSLIALQIQTPGFTYTTTAENNREHTTQE